MLCYIFQAELVRGWPGPLTWACPQQAEFLQKVGAHLRDWKWCEADGDQAGTPCRPVRGCLCGFTGEPFLFLIAEYSYSHLVSSAACIIQVVIQSEMS